MSTQHHAEGVAFLSPWSHSLLWKIPMHFVLAPRATLQIGQSLMLDGGSTPCHSKANSLALLFAGAHQRNASSATIHR